MNTEQTLLACAEEKGKISIIYHGGSQPGSIREILPIRIDGKMLHAKCAITNRFKMFSMEKVELEDNASNISETDPIAQTDHLNPEYHELEQYEDFQDFLEKETNRFESMGWKVEMQDEMTELADGLYCRFLSLGLFLTFKSGKKQKHPVIVFHLLPCEIEGDYWEQKARPYSIQGRSINSKSFVNLDKAAHYFIQQATEIAPN
tara:strand:+ start:403 stop:1014 length:612 start_codon:yes stop_codon:yes gene_type:complete